MTFWHGPDTPVRVSLRTPAHINERIRRQTEANIVYYLKRLDQVDRRLAELDEEWDIERTIEANAGIFMLLGLAFGIFGKKWHALSAVVAGFLVQHAVQGWCPPVSLFRRMGVRTAREINLERFSLKALRGDFRGVDADSEGEPIARAERALECADYGMGGMSPRAAAEDASAQPGEQ